MEKSIEEENNHKALSGETHLARNKSSIRISFSSGRLFITGNSRIGNARRETASLGQKQRPHERVSPG